MPLSRIEIERWQESHWLPLDKTIAFVDRGANLLSNAFAGEADKEAILVWLAEWRNDFGSSAPANPIAGAALIDQGMLR